jgi:DNA-binding XRE family transcriptional regulator
MDIISGNLVRCIRMMKGVKQDTMAKRLGISQPAYSKLEKTSILKSMQIEKINKILQWTIEELEFARKCVEPLNSDFGLMQPQSN